LKIARELSDKFCKIRIVGFFNTDSIGAYDRGRYEDLLRSLNKRVLDRVQVHLFDALFKIDCVYVGANFSADVVINGGSTKAR
jgi:hypothetical protein